MNCRNACAWLGFWYAAEDLCRGVTACCRWLSRTDGCLPGRVPVVRAGECLIHTYRGARVRAGRERGRGVRSVGAGPHHRADQQAGQSARAGEAGVPAASYAMVKRRLPGFAKESWRQHLAAACAAHALRRSCRLVPGQHGVSSPTTTVFQMRAGSFMASHPLVSRGQNVAIGLTGLPDVPANRTGATARWKSHWPSSAAVAAHSSRSQLSSSHRPIATRLTA